MSLPLRLAAVLLSAETERQLADASARGEIVGAVLVPRGRDATSMRHAADGRFLGWATAIQIASIEPAEIARAFHATGLHTLVAEPNTAAALRPLVNGPVVVSLSRVAAMPRATKQPQATAEPLSQASILGLDHAGRCDVLHVMGQHWWPRGDKMCFGIPPNIIAARKLLGTAEEDAAAIEATCCRVVVIHALEHQEPTVRTLAGSFPRVGFVCIFHGSQNVIVRNPIWAGMQRDFLALSNELPNVWYATPEPTIPWSEFGYRRAVVWPNTLPVRESEELPQIDPPTLLIAGRMDIIKAYPVALLAVGLVNRVRPVRVLTAIKQMEAALDGVAEVAGVQPENLPWLDWDAFHETIRSRVSVTVCPSLTDSFNYVAWDSLSQGRPAVGSQTIRYLPRAWQADPNDPRDVARVVLEILDYYPACSRHAWEVAQALAERQRAAYIDLIRRVSK